jgi:hypothetical protein
MCYKAQCLAGGLLQRWSGLVKDTGDVNPSSGLPLTTCIALARFLAQFSQMTNGNSDTRAP